MDLAKFSLEGKVAIVTGAGSGIGKVIAKIFAKCGAKLWLISRTDGKQLLADFENLKPHKSPELVQHYKQDLTDKSTLPEMVDFIYNQSQKIDILVNAAGVNFRVPQSKMTLDIWDQTIDINLTVPYYLSSLVATKMQSNNFGRIINFASLQSYRAFANSIPYGASKGGIVQLTRALAEEYSRHNILVNAIAPGFFRTKMTDVLFGSDQIEKELANKTMMERNGVDEDLFGISVFLASEANSYITGQTIPLDGGFSAK